MAHEEQENCMICGYPYDGTPGCRGCEADRFAPIESKPPPRPPGYREPKIIDEAGWAKIRAGGSSHDA